jgi:hypothetical protein
VSLARSRQIAAKPVHLALPEKLALLPEPRQPSVAESNQSRKTLQPRIPVTAVLE